METEAFRSELADVRSELEPWEKHLIEHKGKLDVASTESKLLNEKVFPDCNIYCLLSTLASTALYLSYASFTL